MATSSSTSHKYGRPVPLLFLASITGTIWVVILLLGIQTSEALMLGQSSGYSPNVQVAFQLVALFRQPMATAHVLAYLFAWIVMATHLLIVIGWDVALTGLHHAAGWLKKLFIAGTIILIGYDLVSNYLWGELPTGAWAHFGVTFAMEFGNLFFGVITVYLIIEAFQSLMHP